eukprot:761591-Pelagomonas_calceolata.AAC.1
MSCTKLQKVVVSGKYTLCFHKERRKFENSIIMKNGPRGHDEYGDLQPDCLADQPVTGPRQPT